ncbi:MAG: hypothetical protein R3B81_06915 [bacterium]|nr:hypothetical protein [Gemmatimonadota bacterium]
MIPPSMHFAAVSRRPGGRWTARYEFAPSGPVEAHGASREEALERLRLELGRRSGRDAHEVSLGVRTLPRSETGWSGV